MPAPGNPSSTLRNQTLPRIILSSTSPRRRQLLENLGLPFIIMTPNAEEATPEAHEVAHVTKTNSLLKAQSVADHLSDPKDIVVSADTLVVIEGEVLEKPRSPSEAREMLEKLSGRTHEVTTGLTLLSKHYGCRQSETVSRVTLRRLTQEEMEEYISTPEPYDKAGGYAVQGLGTLFIDHIDGSYTNVMGLPIETLLRELGALTPFPLKLWFMK